LNVDAILIFDVYWAAGDGGGGSDPVACSPVACHMSANHSDPWESDAGNPIHYVIYCGDVLQK